jgi:creatinine amidohydrolase
MLFTNETYNTLDAAVNKVVLLPLGATEQHGPHLSTGTDTHIVTQIAETAERQCPNDIILTPTLAYGSSHHHMSFGGTISISADLYTQVLREIVSSLIQTGFRRIILLNGHGGNITPARQALALLSKDFDATIQPNIALVTYWELAGTAFAGDSPMESPALSHACEYETSLMLHLFPEKVYMDKVQRATRPEQNGYIPWEDDVPYKGVTMMKQTAFTSSNGSSGEPQLASPGKGVHLFNKATAALIQFIDAFKTWPLMQPLSNQ